ncbi:MAG: hypothetical protein BWY66_00231 [bacterium ADurb.Bin374]|nr:MAG: hypothetical protein BWY66_00231 [bacterium ADurb.Bin374]
MVQIRSKHFEGAHVILAPEQPLGKVFSEDLGIPGFGVFRKEVPHLLLSGVLVAERFAVHEDTVLHALHRPVTVGIGGGKVAPGLQGADRVFSVERKQVSDLVSNLVETAPVEEHVQLPGRLPRNGLDEIPVVEIERRVVVAEIVVGDQRRSEQRFADQFVVRILGEELLVQLERGTHVAAAILLIRHVEQQLGFRDFRLGAGERLHEPRIQRDATPLSMDVEGTLVA